ncbi:serine palmitoyltransferase [Striga asiatica]|uniref:Serine palmitoyltransferase n=1 Tax=Striga asiatica TaxID=4170 RepID=A0A5A7RB23_STRAF|nr:serine palmitoyltransferase [Striga asiatica]
MAATIYFGITTAFTTYFSYFLLFSFGRIRDFSRKIFEIWCSSQDTLQGYAPICSGSEDFYIRRLYTRIQDCFNRPISSAPNAWVDVVERISNDNNKTLIRTNRVTKCLNLGSFNYLGFAAEDEYCTPRVCKALGKFSPTTCSTRVDGGTTALHAEVEECVANFTRKPAAIVFGMGYATNSAIIPVLIGKVRPQKLARLQENSNFFRFELRKMGFEVLGDKDSPIIPVMLYNPGKIPAFSRECLKRNVAVVTVAFPATPLLLARARICISASHTREDLNKALEVINEVGETVGVKYLPPHPKT